MKTRFTIATVIFLIEMFVATSCFGDTITLKGSIRLEPNMKHVTLTDIADMEGAQAKSLADVVIAQFGDIRTVQKVSRHTVQEELEDAGAKWSSINLNGGDVVVRPQARPIVTLPKAMGEVSLENPSPQYKKESDQEPVQATEYDGNTVRASIADYLVKQLQVKPEQLQLTFDPRDSRILNQSITAKRFEIDPLGNVKSDRIGLAVREWDDGVVKHTEYIRVRPHVNRKVAKVIRDLRRGEVIEHTDITIESTWLSPGKSKVLARIDKIIGRAAAKSLRAGDLIREQHLRIAIAVEKGDHLVVRRVVGRHVITMGAVALSDAVRGDTIELARIGRHRARDRETFLAEIIVPGEAIIKQ